MLTTIRSAAFCPHHCSLTLTN